MVSLLKFQAGCENSTLATAMIATAFPFLFGIITARTDSQ